MPGWQRPSCGDRRARRGRRSRRVERPGDGRPGRRLTRLELTEIRRFPNDPVRLPDGLHWDILRLYHEVLGGLREIARAGDSPVSIGVDSWGVDHGLLDEEGRLLGEPYHYRDDRTDGGGGACPRGRRRAPSSTRGPASSSCRSTPSTSWPRPAARRRSRPRGRCCSSPTCSATGCPASASRRSRTPRRPRCSTSIGGRGTPT